MGLGGPAGFGHEHIDHSLLEGGSHIRGADLRMTADMVDHRGLETREREVVALGEHRPGEGDGAGVALFGDRIDGGTAGIPETQIAGHLVEGFTGGIVDGRPKHAIATMSLHQHQQGVTSRHQQHDHRQFDLGILEECGIEMRLEMVHGHERHIPDQCQRLGRADTDEECADETGPDGGGDGIDMVVIDAGLDQRTSNDWSEQFHMGTAGDLGDHTTEAGMEVDLARHDRREHLMPVDHDSGGRLVTAGLDSQYPGAHDRGSCSGRSDIEDIASAGTVAARRSTTTGASRPASISPSRSR